MTVEYDRIDFALLFELRLAIEEERLLPLPMLRVLDARGWITMPDSAERLPVDTHSEGLRFPSAAYEVGPIHLTPLGTRELALFREQLDYGDMLAILAEEEGLDEDDLEDEDGD